MTIPILEPNGIQFYGVGSSPTTQQILEGIVANYGVCSKCLRHCVPVSTGLLSDRAGDSCPMFNLVPPVRPDCPMDDEDRYYMARKLLMELNDHGQLQKI